MSDSEFKQVTEEEGKKDPTFRVAVRRGAVTALVVGALLVVSAGLGGTASGGLRAQKTAFAPLRLDATRLSIGLRVTPRTATRGQTVTYLLRVSNVGSDPARLLRVCDQVPLRMILVSAPPGFVSTHHRLECRRFASLPVGGTVIFKFRMKVSPSARGGVVINTAYARARGMVSFIYAQVPLTIGVRSGCSRSAC
jgi:uncharacterized repeat protein (TIGR01451 family)